MDVAQPPIHRAIRYREEAVLAGMPSQKTFDGGTLY
jgi:hypothetical protein